MSGGGGGGNTTSTTSTKVELPKWYEPYAQQAAGQAFSQSQVPYQQYSAERIAPFTSQQEQGLGLVSSLGANNPLSGAANQQAISTLSGAYLDPTQNPAWASGVEDIGQAYREITAPTTNALFSKAGAFGTDNSAFNQYTGYQQEGMADALGKTWGDIYNQERSNQMSTLGMTPGLNQTTYGDYQNLIGAGDAYRQLNQDQLNLAYSDWLEKQQYPWTQLQNFAGLGPQLLGNSGGTSGTSTGPNPYQTSPIAGAVGGGAAAAGVASMIPAIASTGYGIPIAALLGAIAGGALS